MPTPTENDYDLTSCVSPDGMYKRKSSLSKEEKREQAGHLGAVGYNDYVEDGRWEEADDFTLTMLVHQLRHAMKELHEYLEDE